MRTGYEWLLHFPITVIHTCIKCLDILVHYSYGVGCVLISHTILVEITAIPQCLELWPVSYKCWVSFNHQNIAHHNITKCMV